MTSSYPKHPNRRKTERGITQPATDKRRPDRCNLAVVLGTLGLVSLIAFGTGCSNEHEFVIRKLKVGNHRYRVGNYTEAIEKYATVIERVPNTAVAHYNIALAHSQLYRAHDIESHARSAIEHFQIYLDLVPTDCSVCFEMRSIYNSLDDMSGALEYWERRSQADPDSTIVLVELARTSQRAGKHLKAVEYYRRAAAAATTAADKAAALLALGRTQQQRVFRAFGEERRRLVESGLDAAQEAIAIVPNSREIHLLIADLLLDRSRSQEDVQAKAADKALAAKHHKLYLELDQSTRDTSAGSHKPSAVSKRTEHPVPHAALRLPAPRLNITGPATLQEACDSQPGDSNSVDDEFMVQSTNCEKLQKARRRTNALATSTDEPSPDAELAVTAKTLATSTDEPSPDAEPAVKAKIVPQYELEQLRISGQKRIVPDDATKLKIERGGKSRVITTMKMCVSERGIVTNLTTLLSPGYPAYERTIKTKMKLWRYRPFNVNGKPVPVCTSVTLIYRQGS